MKPSAEMVEAAALALINERREADGLGPTQWEQLDSQQKEILNAQARAALTAALSVQPAPVQGGARDTALRIVREHIDWMRSARPKPIGGFPPEYFADELVDAITKTFDALAAPSPAPSVEQMREALIEALSGLKYIQPAIPVLRTMLLTKDMQLGAKQAEAMDASNKEAIKKLEAVLTALSVQPACILPNAGPCFCNRQGPCPRELPKSPISP